MISAIFPFKSLVSKMGKIKIKFYRRKNLLSIDTQRLQKVDEKLLIFRSLVTL